MNVCKILQTVSWAHININDGIKRDRQRWITHGRNSGHSHIFPIVRSASGALLVLVNRTYLRPPIPGYMTNTKLCTSSPGITLRQVHIHPWINFDSQKYLERVAVLPRAFMRKKYICFQSDNHEINCNFKIKYNFQSHTQFSFPPSYDQHCSNAWGGGCV